MKKIASLILSLLLIALYSSLVWAAEEPYPSKPINLIVTMAPGGVMDFQAKLIGDRLSEVLGQPITKAHKPGAGGTMAVSLTARAKPDGYTMVTGTSTNIIFSPLVKKLDYTWEDLIPISIYAKGVVRLYVKTDAKWKTVEDFIADAKERQLKVCSFGKLTPPDFVIQVLNKRAGINLAHIPYKSCGEAVTALLGGHVDGDFCTSSMGQVQAGAVRVLAAADHERSKFEPDIRTFKELGYPVAFSLWNSFCVPKKTPKRIVDILSNGMQEVFKRHGKEIEAALPKIEYVAYFLTREQTLQELKRDYEFQSALIKELGVFAE